MLCAFLAHLLCVYYLVYFIYNMYCRHSVYNMHNEQICITKLAAQNLQLHVRKGMIANGRGAKEPVAYLTFVVS